MFLDLLSLLWAPFLMCLVLTGIHAYLGVHVLAREVVFVDIALAQIAALGATAAFMVGYEMDTWESYASGLSATLLGAVVLASTRSRRRHVSQEAVIGVVYAVSSAAAVLLADRAPHGTEQVRTMLVGNLLAVRMPEVAKVATLYALIGLFHWLCRRPFFQISTDPDAAYREGWRVRLWAFLFYASFGVVVTSSVRIAGVLLVFSYLIVPALAGILLGRTVTQKLLIGWGFGTLVSVIGMTASAVLDLPTGATVVCAFGLTLIALWVAFQTVRPSTRLTPPACDGFGASSLSHRVVAGERGPDVGSGKQHGHDDLDRGVAPEPLAADRGARGLAALAEELDQQVGGAVDHARLVAEARRRVHEAQQVDDLLHAVQVAERVLDRRQRRDHRLARRLVALGEREVLADDAGQIGLAALPRGRAREIEQVLHRVVRDVVGARRIRAVEILEARQLESERGELVLHVHACPPGSMPCPARPRPYAPCAR